MGRPKIFEDGRKTVKLYIAPSEYYHIEKMAGGKGFVNLWIRALVYREMGWKPK